VANELQLASINYEVSTNFRGVYWNYCIGADVPEKSRVIGNTFSLNAASFIRYPETHGRLQYIHEYYYESSNDTKTDDLSSVRTLHRPCTYVGRFLSW